MTNPTSSTLEPQTSTYQAAVYNVWFEIEQNARSIKSTWTFDLWNSRMDRLDYVSDMEEQIAQAVITAQPKLTKSHTVMVHDNHEYIVIGEREYWATTASFARIQRVLNAVEWDEHGRMQMHWGTPVEYTYYWS